MDEVVKCWTSWREGEVKRCVLKCSIRNRVRVMMSLKMRGSTEMYTCSLHARMFTNTCICIGPYNICTYMYIVCNEGSIAHLRSYTIIGTRMCEIVLIRKKPLGRRIPHTHPPPHPALEPTT